MELTRNGHPRVVITGIDILTALGDLTETWSALMDGKSGIRQLQNIDTTDLGVRIGAEVHNFDPGNLINRKEMRRMGRSTQFAIVTATRAIQASGLTFDKLSDEGDRVGVVIGTTLGPHEIAVWETAKFYQEHHRVNPTMIVNTVPNMPAYHITQLIGSHGPLLTASSACASGTHALGLGMDLIRYGRCDIVVSGGLEALLYDYVVAGFDSMGALAKGFEDQPEKASRPFDATRTGFVLGEASGMFILESLEHALARNATIYAEVLGYGVSADAYHPAAMDDSADGIVKCMKWALDDAKLHPEQIQYVNPHGSSTPLNDSTETLAIKRVFGDHAYKLGISSTKSMLGHALGASGAIEAAVTVMSICDRRVHPTINLYNPDPVCDLDYIPNEGRDMHELKYAISNSFGLGGQNATIVLGNL